MGLIVSVIVILFFSYDLYYNKISSGTKKAVVFLFTLVALFAIVVFPNLPDINAYKKTYDNYRLRGLVDAHVDVGYFFLVRIFSFLDFNFYFFRCFTTLLFTLLFIRGIVKCSNNISLSLLFFFTGVYIVSFLIQVRVGFGLAIIIGFGLPCYVKGKYFNFFVSVIIACFFHISLVVIIVPFLLSCLFKTKKIKFILLCVTLLLLRFNVTDMILNYAVSLAQIPYLAKIMTYINVSGQHDAFLSTRDYVSIIVLLFTLKDAEDRMLNFMYWSYFCCLIFKLIFRNFGEIGVRFYMLFQYALVFLMSMSYQRKKFIARCLIIVFLIVNFIMLISNYGSGSIINNANFSNRYYP
jgi:hypothetical protein